VPRTWLLPVRWLAASAGLVLLGIGIRFLLVPQKAARFFGIAPLTADVSAELSYVIGLRDIWLALLVLVLSAVGDWRGLAVWLGLGAAVCLGDAAIAASSSGRPLSVGFHLGSGVYCAVLALICWRHHRQRL
jgi:Domain of unknown function (DUF4267)